MSSMMEVRVAASCSPESSRSAWNWSVSATVKTALSKSSCYYHVRKAMFSSCALDEFKLSEFIKYLLDVSAE